MAHIYVATAGYSKRVVPAGVPFEFALAENDALIASPAWRNAPPSRHVLVDSPIDPRSASDLVADVVDGPGRREWWIETSVYSVPLLRGWTAIISGEVSPAFDLVRGECGIFIQTARNRPGLDSLAAAGQSEIARGSDDHIDWVELSYVLENRRWIQRHSLFRDRPQVMMTGQGPADQFPPVRVAQDELGRRVEFSR